MNHEVKTLGKLTYVIRYPDSFESCKTYPTILCLHGAGGRGSDVQAVLDNPFFRITETMPDFPFVMVAPLCSENTWFDLFHELKQLVAETAHLPFVDEKRLYMMGASMGGYATWQLAMSLPEYFAAIAPICGGGMYWNGSRLTNVPVWAFHGALDECVFPEESKKMVQAVQSCGGEAKLTLYPHNYHDAWSDTYSNPELYSWFLQHENHNLKALQDKYHGTEQYG